MIRIVIEIDVVESDRAGVRVSTAPFNPREQPDSVGRAFIGIMEAINGYMHANGAPQFDCLKRNRP
jgi:hypothetical protein